jgi:hypothetical protein
MKGKEMTKYKLSLYVEDSTDIPMSVVTTSLNRATRRALAAKAKIKTAKFGHAYIKVEEGSDLFDIPNGTNPRALNGKSTKVKNIKKTLLEEVGFAVYNGGLCIVIDDNSLQYDPVAQTISFTCDQVDSGHYDGQHTLEAVLQGVPDLEHPNQVAISFVENCFFVDTAARLHAAETWNTRDPQKLHSVLNARGAFDILKSALSPLFVDNISWLEGQTNASGDIIGKECRADRVVALLYTAVPLLQSEHLSVGDELYNILRKGYKSALILDDADQRADFEKVYPIANEILEMADYIQATLRDSYEARCTATESFDSLAITRKSGKADMKKDVEKRKFFNQVLFDGTTVEGALRIDYMQPIMYGLLQGVLQRDRRSGAPVFRYTLDEVMAIWDEACYEVLNLFDERFRGKFSSHFNSRAAEFGCWTYLWQSAEAIVSDVISDGNWRKNLPL